MHENTETRNSFVKADLVRVILLSMLIAAAFVGLRILDDRTDFFSNLGKWLFEKIG